MPGFSSGLIAPVPVGFQTTRHGLWAQGYRRHQSYADHRIVVRSFRLNYLIVLERHLTSWTSHLTVANSLGTATRQLPEPGFPLYTFLFVGLCQELDDTYHIECPGCIQQYRPYEAAACFLLFFQATSVGFCTHSLHAARASIEIARMICLAELWAQSSSLCCWGSRSKCWRR